MAGFLYFFPNCNHSCSEVNSLPPETGLRELLKGANITRSASDQGGPEGHRGKMVCIHKPDREPRIAFMPDSQEWVKVTNKEEIVTHWIGWEKANPPTPEDLVRDSTIDGHYVRMGRHEWLIPVVHAQKSTLPQRFRVLPGGAPSMEFEPEYQWMVKWVSDFMDKWTRNETPGYEESFDFFIATLKVNYYLGAWEVCECLKMLNTKSSVPLLLAATGVIALREEAEARAKNSIPPSGE